MAAPMSVTERERLARRLAAELAPRLRSAIDRDDAERVADLTLGLDRQELLALVVVLASEWPRVRCRQMVDCRHCGEYDRHEGDGYCVRCHRLWDAAGRPDTGPPPPMPNTESGRLGALHLIKQKTERLEDFADLDEWGADYREAADRLGVSPSTVFRYRAELAAAPLQLRIPELRRAS